MVTCAARLSKRFRCALAVLLLGLGGVLVSCSDNSVPGLRVAVAANFRPALEALRADFEQQCDCRLDIVSGATGMLYSQIQAAAPFDIFLAADSRRPQLLAREGLILPDSLHTYARGQLALWASRSLLAGGSGDIAGFVPAAQASPEQLRPILRNWRGKVVIADPQVAPYGHAAVELMRKLGVWQRLQNQMVYAANVGHAQILLQEGHAQLGLIPVSLALVSGSRGDYMTIPGDQYPVLRQQSVILRNTKFPNLARQFQAYLLSHATQRRLPDLGYSPAVVR